MLGEVHLNLSSQINAIPHKELLNRFIQRITDIRNGIHNYVDFDFTNFNFNINDYTTKQRPVYKDYLGTPDPWPTNVLKGLSFTNVTFKNCDFSHVSLQAAKFKNVVFENCLFDGSVFEGASFDQVRFVESTVKDSSFHDAEFVGVDFNGCTLLHNYSVGLRGTGAFYDQGCVMEGCSHLLGTGDKQDADCLVLIPWIGLSQVNRFRW